MNQMALSLEPGIAARYRDLRECVATCIYAHGLGRVAAELDLAPSNLSAMLAGDRALPTDVVERYMECFKDLTPARYIASRFLQDPALLQASALAALPDAIAQLSNLMHAAGLQIPKAKTR
jgi:hypothetical protein